MEKVSYRLDNGKYGCVICKQEGKVVAFANSSGLSKHRRNNHISTSATASATNSTTTSATTSISVSSNNKGFFPIHTSTLAQRPPLQLQLQLQQLVPPVPTQKSLAVLYDNDCTKQQHQQHQHQQQQQQQQQPVYFNNDLKYYIELTRIMGKENALNYLLYTLPKTKNPFDALQRILQNQTRMPMPICISDKGDFIIIRDTNDRENDNTGGKIDYENKKKLKDAVLTAYAESTKERDKKLFNIRLAQVSNGLTELRPYTDVEINLINSIFTESTEPRVLFNILDSVDRVKTKRSDFDALRKICMEGMLQYNSY